MNINIGQNIAEKITASYLLHAKNCIFI